MSYELGVGVGLGLGVLVSFSTSMDAFQSLAHTADSARWTFQYKIKWNDSKF